MIADFTPWWEDVWEWLMGYLHTMGYTRAEIALRCRNDFNPNKEDMEEWKREHPEEWEKIKRENP